MIYDAATAAIKKIDPDVKFVGPELATFLPDWAAYFLNPASSWAR